MPEPVSMSVPPPSFSSLDDDPPLDLESEAGAATAPSNTAPNACLPIEVPSEAAVCSTTSDLVQKFTSNEPAVVAAASPPSSPTPTAPPVLSIGRDQITFQTGIPRIEAHAALGSAQLTAGIDVLNVNGHVGTRNDDGSHGANIGLGATLLGGEVNVDYKGWSLTMGVAASVGGSVSSGEGRDLDADGVEERCFKLSLGPWTLGECDEL